MVSQDDDVEEVAQKDNEKSERDAYADRRYFDLDKSNKYWFFGCEDEYITMKRSKTDKIISSTSEPIISSTIHSMTVTNMIDRIHAEVMSDEYTTEEDKLKIRETFKLLIYELARRPDQSSPYEIETYDSFRRISLASICNIDFPIEEKLRPICIDYCVRAFPLVRKQGSAPIFTVEYVNHRDGWKLTWYHPTAETQTMLLGVPKTVMSACGLQYDVSLIDSMPAQQMRAERAEEDGIEEKNEIEMV